MSDSRRRPRLRCPRWIAAAATLCAISAALAQGTAAPAGGAAAPPAPAASSGSSGVTSTPDAATGRSTPPRGSSPSRNVPSGDPPTTRTAPRERTLPIDRVVAIVNDEALTQFDIAEQKRVVLAQMQAQKVTPPPSDVLDKQLLDRLITERVLIQFAKETGIRIDDTQVERALQRIAQDNKLSPDDFKRAVEREGLTFARYRDDIRNEMAIQKLREREVDGRVNVSDAEVDHFLATQAAQSGGDVEYRIAHILVLVPEQASPEVIDARFKRAEDALRQIRTGGDFAQIAAGYSDAADALQGGNLGWRTPARLPTVFADPIRGMKPGQVSGVLRSANGFHIVKLLETRNRNAPTVVDQTHARHILIKVNEVTSEAEAKAKIDRIKDRIDSGGKFDEQAKLNSEDASAVKGGDLGWISPGDTVPDFEQAMAKLAPGESSGPVRTQFGWHLIEVIERRTQDITAERQRDQARMALRQRKSDELFQDWVRQTRDRAYVELKIDE
jgi:peptidyl-prolyl cis-trans isomerase SurA